MMGVEPKEVRTGTPTVVQLCSSLGLSVQFLLTSAEMESATWLPMLWRVKSSMPRQISRMVKRKMMMRGMAARRRLGSCPWVVPGAVMCSLFQVHGHLRHYADGTALWGWRLGAVGS